MIWAALILAEPHVPPVGAGMRIEALLQYQYKIDAPQCHVSLSDGTKIELDGLFANDEGSVFFTEIVNLGVKTNSAFQFASIVSVEGAGVLYPAKVVKAGDGWVFFAMDATFLEKLWGAAGQFKFKNIGEGAYVDEVQVALADENVVDRISLSRAKACYAGALNVD